MSDNWVVQNLENALNTWNEKLAEIWQLVTQSPEQFKGGTIWNVIVNIHGALQAIGLALLVLFFVVGVMRTCGNFAEVKKPEHALKLFIRFALAKGAVTYGLELMMALFKIVQGVISTIMNAAGFGTATQTVLPSEIVTAVEDCGFFESIPLSAVTLIGGLFHYDNVGVRQIFQTLPLYRYRPCSSFCLCRRAEPERRQELYQVLCCRVFGGCNHSACLHHLFALCSDTACGQSRCGGGHNGMELCRGACIQYARLGRCGQNGRPCCP